MSDLKRLSKPSIWWALRIFFLGTGKPLKLGCGPIGWILKIVLRVYLPYLYYTQEGYFVDLEAGEFISFDVKEPANLEEGLRSWFNSRLVRQESQPIRDILETKNFELADGFGFLDWRLWWTFQATGQGDKAMGNCTIGEPSRDVKKRLLDWGETWEKQQKPIEYRKEVEQEAEFLNDVEDERQKKRGRRHRGALFH